MSNKALFKKDRAEKWLPVRLLSVKFAESQRPLSQTFVDSISGDNLNPYKIGRIDVAQVNGTYHICDGQHRVAAVRQTWGDDEMVPCDVIPADSAEEAADIFLDKNVNRRGISAIDKFKISVTAKRPEYVAVNNLLTGLGFTVASGTEDGTFAAVASAVSIYRKYGDAVLKDALLIILSTWGKDRNAVHTNLVQGYAELVAEQGHVLDRKRLADRVAKDMTPGVLLGRGKTHSEMNKVKRAQGVVRALVVAYNHGLRTEARLETPGY